ncbi:MAG: glycosyltransferase family 2 protein [Nitrospirae bacterium]|nr:glycosyltransferase family 2 protein [Nitrospirota bacterium]
MPIDGPEVSVVIPVYRNADTLSALYQRVRQALETHGLTDEVVFVDDACPANSLAVLSELAGSDSRVAVLALASNVGQHRAVLAGLSHARGERVVILDADLQDPPEAIPDLLAKMQEGFAAVFAGRRGWYESPARLLTSHLFKWLLHKASGVPADAGLFVAMNRTMAERLLASEAPRPFLVAQMGFTGLLLASIPVARTRRPGGGSAYSFRARLMIGVRALLWAISHGRRMSRQENGPRAHQAPVKAYIGARFSHPDGAGWERVG